MVDNAEDLFTDGGAARMRPTHSQQLLRGRSRRRHSGGKIRRRRLDLARTPRGTPVQAAALIGLADPRGAAACARPCWGIRPTCSPRWRRRRPVPGGHVLQCEHSRHQPCGDVLALRHRRVDTQILLTDAAHRPLLDGLDLPGVTVLDTSSTHHWAQLLAQAARPHPTPRMRPDDTLAMMINSSAPAR